MPRYRSLFFLLASSLWLFSLVQAQERRGAITGHVTDSTGGALIGAQISVQPKGVSVVSDTQGQFFINNLEPTGYTVTVSYVGFKTFTQTVNVNAGQAASVEAKLGVESQNLEVLVTAERPSAEAEAVNRERSADITQRISPVTASPTALMAA
jgi:hypothetical protein